MGRGKRQKGDTGRMAGGFAALPWAVLDSPAWQRLSHPARSLLLELARQLVADNNGRLLASGVYLSKRGWRSNDVVNRALRELVEAGFLHQTVQGHRPNKASWYAVTWQRLSSDRAGFDPGTAETFRRGAFMDGAPLPQPKPTRQELYDKWGKNASLTPSHGVGDAPIAPSHGVEASLVAPSHGAMEAEIRPSPTPSDGDHLDIAIYRDGESASVPHVKARAAASLDTGEVVRRFHEGSACARLFDALMAHPRGVAELEALGIANPRQRVRELRERGYRIVRQPVDGRLPYRYVLLSTAPVTEPAEVSL